MGRIRTPLALLAAACIALIAASPASGAANRADFVQRVDPICKSTQKQTAKLLATTKATNRARGRAFETIAARGLAAISEIYRIGPAPQGTELVLWDRWIQKLQLEVSLVDQMGTALKQGQVKRARGYSRQAADADRRAAHIVRSYGFRYCDRSAVGSP